MADKYVQQDPYRQKSIRKGASISTNLPKGYEGPKTREVTEFIESVAQAGYELKDAPVINEPSKAERFASVRKSGLSANTGSTLVIKPTAAELDQNFDTKPIPTKTTGPSVPM